ncbi:NCS2 family permease [uncultured Parasutterella sp.]|uniref:NCS2 family permease n=1 Tax=uncultured Parasutterella sp. TaxID=1263098 RepID=UPI0025964139|nr:NCS2 family permease [uncultured Parasutterella sp.]
MNAIDRFFKISERGSNVKTEFLGAISAYLAVCYLFIVVPGMLSDAGMPIADATVATIWAAILGTVMIAFIANFPIVVAPGLGISAYFAYYVCGAMGLSWQAACAAVVISGFVFFLLTVTRVRQAIIQSIPLDLKLAIVAGIGAFITIIGLKNAGIVVPSQSTMIGLGNMLAPQAYLTILGVIIAGVLINKGVRLGMLIAILAVAVLGVALGVTPIDGVSKMFPADFKIFPTETIFQVDFKTMMTVGIVGVLFSITMVDLFDNMSTLIGLSFRAGFMGKGGEIPGLDKALISDSVATMGAGLIGTPTSTAILESAVGIEAGARTGLCALFLAGFFVLTLFITPVLTLVPAFATACVLILVGYMMMQGTVTKINFHDISTGVPCFFTIFMMPFTFNIATGLGFGVISFVLLKLLCGKAKEISLTMAILAVVFCGILVSH